MDRDVVRDIEGFLYREARLLDQRAYQEWLSLWTDDALYWVPVRDDTDPTSEVSLIYDDRKRLEDRIHRLTSGAAWAQEPPSRTLHVISNVECQGLQNDEFTVHSNFTLATQRRGLYEIFAGRAIHTLRAEADGLKIVQKKILLLNSDEPMHDLSILV